MTRCTRSSGRREATAELTTKATKVLAHTYTEARTFALSKGSHAVHVECDSRDRHSFVPLMRLVSARLTAARLACIIACATPLKPLGERGALPAEVFRLFGCRNFLVPPSPKISKVERQKTPTGSHSPAPSLNVTFRHGYVPVPVPVWGRIDAIGRFGDGEDLSWLRPDV